MVGLLSVPRKVRNFAWGEPPEDPREAKLLFKIDCFVLSYMCLNFWVNYLDQTNIANAYVSGMQEDLNMAGNEYNIIISCFTVGFIVGIVPSNLILLKVRPRYWLTACTFVWGLFTLAVYKCENYKQICVLRFFQGVCESSTFVGCQLILASWYNSKDVVNPATGRAQSSELTKRTAIFTCSGLVGSMFSSFLQAAIFENMDGYGGLRGWRWLFIIDFIITVPICIYGFIFFPDTPETCKAFYFTKDEIELARLRVKNPEVVNKFDRTLLRRVFGRWHFYLFNALWAFSGENISYCSNSLFAVWLKYYDYTVEQRNHYPMGMYAIGMVGTLGCALYVDHTGGNTHWHTAIFISVVLLVAAIMMLANPRSHTVVFIAQYIAGISYSSQTTFFAWANVACRNDLQERAVVLATMNMFSYSLNAWWSIVFYAVTTLPDLRRGSFAMIGTTIVTAFIAVAIMVLQRRDDQKEASMVSDIESSDLERTTVLEGIIVDSKVNHENGHSKSEVQEKTVSINPEAR